MSARLGSTTGRASARPTLGWSLAVHARATLVALGVTIGALAACNAPAHAMPADPRPHDYRQPDGSTVTLYLRGDEWMHWYADTGGHAVIEDAGTWRYAKVGLDGDLVATPYAVGSVLPEAVGLKAGIRPRPSAQAIAEHRALHTTQRVAGAANTSPFGTVRNLVVLCSFSDHTVAAQGRALAAYDSLFNTVNSTGFNAPTGSVRDFYTQASFGQLTLQSTVVAWITLPQTEAYYANNLNGLPFAAFGKAASPYPTNAAGMAQAALAALDATVNFATFDQDNDGFVDAIDFIHSGYGGETNGNGTQRIWSHKYNLSSANGGPSGGQAWTSADKNTNNVNVKVDLYHTEPARWGSPGNANLVRVGVIAHETGHFFGLPDLYDLDQSSYGIGNWCTMANSWGWDQTQYQPPLFSAWCRLQLGWVTPTDIVAPGSYAVSQSETSGQVLRISNGMPSGEYLLIESRQPVGFDQQIPNGGIAVWHIDDNVGGNTNEGSPSQAGWPTNGNHYKVALLEADGNYDLEHTLPTIGNPNPPQPGNNGDAGDLYRASGRWLLNEATVPNTDSYSVGSGFWPTGTDIRVLSDPGSFMTVTVRPGLWVDPAASGPEYGTYQWPFHSLSNAINLAQIDAGIVCKSSTIHEAPPFTKPLIFRSWNGATTIAP